MPCASRRDASRAGRIADLLDPASPRRGRRLGEPQRRALAVALGSKPHPPTTPDRIGAATCVRSRIFARSRAADTVLVAIDDVAVARSGFAANRSRLPSNVSRDTPVGVLITQRGQHRRPTRSSATRSTHRFAEIRLGPLSAGALHHLIRTRLGVRIPRPTLRGSTSPPGNPMFALEFARSFAGRIGRSSVQCRSLPRFTISIHARVRALPAEPTQSARYHIAAVVRPTPSLLATVDPACGRLARTSCRCGCRRDRRRRHRPIHASAPRLRRLFRGDSSPNAAPFTLARARRQDVEEQPVTSRSRRSRRTLRSPPSSTRLPLSRSHARPRSCYRVGAGGDPAHAAHRSRWSSMCAR